MRTPLVLVGTRYNILPLLEIAEATNYEVIGILDRFYVGQKFEGINVIGSDLDLLDKENQTIQDLVSTAEFFVCTYFPGYTNTNNPNENTFLLRLQRIDLVKRAGCQLANLIHPKADISKYATVGKNTLALLNSYVEPRATVENFCTLMQGVGIGHNSIVGENCSFSGDGGVAGSVTMGKNVYVGVNVRILNTMEKNVTVGDNVIIGPGLIIMKDIPADTIVYPNGKMVPNYDFDPKKYEGNGIFPSYQRLTS